MSHENSTKKEKPVRDHGLDRSAYRSRTRRADEKRRNRFRNAGNRSSRNGSDWIKKAAGLERQRRKRVEEFAAATQIFLREFAKEVDDDITAFNLEFPDEQVRTEFPGPLEFRIQRFTNSRNTPYLARLLALPERSVLVLVIVHEDEEFRSAEIAAQVVRGQLRIRAGSPAPLEIRVQLLFPILFPELSADSNALSDLQG
jgi:hypothetical protein